MSADRPRTEDAPDSVAPPPDPSLIPADEPPAEPDPDAAVENIEKDGEPFGGNFA